MENILTAAELRQRYQTCPPLSKLQNHSEYLKFLQGKGLQLNSKVFLSSFELKNGLSYTGLATNSELRNQTIIRVPEAMVLNTLKALKQPALSHIYQDAFYSRNNQKWQYRVLTTYCIFLLIQGDADNPWFEMVKRFQKSCDLVPVWDQQLIQSINDPIFQVLIGRRKGEFEEEWEEFKSCRGRHGLLQREQYGYENYRVIYSNTWNRSFGKYVKYSSLVPFADFINHHASKVYYTVELKQEHLGSKEVEEDNQSSNDSYDSFNSDYGQSQFQPQPQEIHQTASIESQKLHHLHEYMMQHPQPLIKYYDSKQHHSYFSSALLKNKSIESPFQIQYQSFVIRASKLDYFPANNQIYFRYGRDTNRNLLLDYGFAIEGNKYEYVSIIPTQSALTRALTGLMGKITNRKVSLFRKFKIYRHLLNTDLIVYLRATRQSHPTADIFTVGDFGLEILVLQEAIALLLSHLQRFHCHNDLSDKTLTYQQYFIQVYHHEKCLILKTQVAMLQRLIALLRAVQSGKDKQSASLCLTGSERKAFGRYLGMMAL